MGVITKINGIAVTSLSKINGVDINTLDSINGEEIYTEPVSSLTAFPLSLDFPVYGGMQYIMITASGAWTVTFGNYGMSNLMVSPLSGYGEGSVTVGVEYNLSGMTVGGWVRITDGTNSVMVELSQAG